MPIDYGIDRERRLVVAAPFGVMTDADTFGYHRDVWSLPEVAGFDELIDMSAVESIALPSAKRVEDLARLSAQMDWESGSHPQRMAIYAPSDISYGLGRMYQAYRAMRSDGSRRVGVFRTLEEALAFLGLEPGREADKILGLARNRIVR
jgi:hypothetical protein